MTVRDVCIPLLALVLTACRSTQPTGPEMANPSVAFYVNGSSGNGICGGSLLHQHTNGVDGTCNGTAGIVHLRKG